MDVDYDEYYVRPGDKGAKDVWPALLDTVEKFVANPTHDTLAIDSLTTLCDTVVAHVVGKAGRVDLQLQDYNSVYTELTKLIVRLRRSPSNVILTAHEERERDEFTGKVQIRPLVIGQSFGPKLPIYFNNIYSTIVDAKTTGPERYLLVQSDGTRLAKTQAKNSDVKIVKSYDSIIQHLQKKKLIHGRQEQLL
jgi:hypothetical protein